MEKKVPKTIDEEVFEDIPTEMALALLLPYVRRGLEGAQRKWIRGSVYWRAIKLGMDAERARQLAMDPCLSLVRLKCEEV